ncbi:MAG: ceramidase domain-containing protein [Pseudomonadota bacterium]
MNEYIDIYCERLEPGLFAEPLNAITNIAFFIAAFFALRLAQSENALDWRSGTLIGLTFAIGVGSTLFHTFATLWAMLTDVLPILAFQIAFITLYAQRVMCMRCRWSFALVALFIVVMQIFMQMPRDWLNGTLEYAPALIFVTGFGLWHLKNAAREKWGLLAAAALFVASMTLRSIDMQICEIKPLGTHYFWHIFNGGVLYLSTRAYILNAKR